MGDFSREIFERRAKETSWCKTCANRNTCKNKETVAWEQTFVTTHATKYLDVTVKCRGYKKDLNLPYAADTLESLFKLWWR